MSSHKKLRNRDWHTYDLLIKDNHSRTTEFPKFPTTDKADRLAYWLNQKTGEKFNDNKYHHDIQLDTFAVGVTDKTIYVATNSKSRCPAQLNQENVKIQNPKGQGGTSRVTYDNYSFHSGNEAKINYVVDIVKTSDVYKQSNLNLKLVESKNAPSGTMLNKAKENARDHAEMKILSHVHAKDEKLRRIGISKEACEGCHKNLKNNNVNITTKPGTKKVTNWEDPKDINTEVVYNANRSNKCEFKASLGSQNVEFSKEAFHRNAKNQIRNSLKPGASVGIVSGIAQLADTIDREDYDEYVDADVMNARAGVQDNLLEVGKICYANANLAEFKAGAGSMAGIGGSMLSASAYAGYGLDNTAGVDLSLVKVQGNLGPINVRAGLNADCNASFGVNGVGITILGTGFHLGPKMSFKTPFFDFSLNLF